MKKKLFTLLFVFSVVLSFLYRPVTIRAYEKTIADEWYYTEWSDWYYYTISEKQNSYNSMNADDTIQTKYAYKTCSKWFLICFDYDYTYKRRERNRYYKNALEYSINNEWYEGSLYEVTKVANSTLVGFEQKQELVKKGYYQTIGYEKKTVTKYTQWSN